MKVASKPPIGEKFCPLGGSDLSNCWRCNRTSAARTAMADAAIKLRVGYSGAVHLMSTNEIGDTHSNWFHAVQVKTSFFTVGGYNQIRRPSLVKTGIISKSSRPSPCIALVQIPGGEIRLCIVAPRPSELSRLRSAPSPNCEACRDWVIQSRKPELIPVEKRSVPNRNLGPRQPYVVANWPGQ